MEQLEKKKIVIIGASISGLAAAKRIRRLNENVEITLIDCKEYIGYPITGLPYFTAGLLKSHKTFTVGYLEDLKNIYNIRVLTSSLVYKIDFNNNIIYIKNLKTDDKTEELYDYLILATGLKIDLSDKFNINNCNNLFKIQGIEEAIKAREYLEKSGTNRITIVGDNILSLSFMNNFLKNGYEIVLLTKNNRLLPQFDPELSYLIEEELIKKGVKIYKNFNIIKFKKNNGLITSLISNLINIDVQVLFYFDDIVPNTSYIDRTIILSGINNNTIIANNNFKTYFNNVFATGSAVEVKEKITEKNIYTISARESELRGRIVADSVINEILGKNEENKKKYNGYIRNDFISIKDFYAGIVGINEEEAKRNGFDFLSVTLVSGDKERFIASKSKIYLKVIIDRINRKILGAQICGENSNVDKRIDILYTAIYSELTVDDLINLNLSYSPEISLIKDPINIVGRIGANILDGFTNYITNFDFKLNENIFILDIRTKEERKKSFLLKSHWIPLNELRNRLNEIPKEKRIYIYGNNGVREYIAERILKQNNFNLVYNIAGGIEIIKIKENIF